jgi:hypothetical protein
MYKAALFPKVLGQWQTFAGYRMIREACLGMRECRSGGAGESAQSDRGGAKTMALDRCDGHKRRSVRSKTNAAEGKQLDQDGGFDTVWGGRDIGQVFDSRRCECRSGSGEVYSITEVFNRSEMSE